MSKHGTWLGMGACALMATVMACAAGSAKQAPSPPSATAGEPTPMGDTPRSGSQHDKIARLYDEIERQLSANGMDLPSAPACMEQDQNCARASTDAQVMGVKPLVPGGGDHQCKRSEADTCHDVCTLSDSICSNAEKICDIAKELGDQDGFANEKCARGTSACKASQQRCCSCM